MNTQRFRNGQPVVALKSVWLDADTIRELNNPATPKKGLVYHIRGQELLDGSWYLLLAECPDEHLSFDQQFFAPLQEHPEDAIAALLAEAFEGELVA